MTDQPMMTVPVPDVEDVEITTPSHEPFELLVQRRMQMKEQIKKLEEEIAKTDVVIGAALDLSQLKSVTWHREYIVTRREGTKARASLSREKLLELGVAPQTIEAATVYGKPGKPGVTISKIGRRGSADGEFE